MENLKNRCYFHICSNLTQMTASNGKILQNYVSIHLHYPIQQVTKRVGSLVYVIYLNLFKDHFFGGGIWVCPQPAVPFLFISYLLFFTPEACERTDTW